MPFLAVTGLVNFVTCSALGCFVLLRNFRRAQNVAYFLGNSAIAIYSIGYFLWQLSDNAFHATHWFRLLTLGIILINMGFLYFVTVFLDLVKEKRWILWLSLLINLGFIVCNYNSMLYTHLEGKYGLGFWPVPARLFHLYLIFWFWQCFYGFYLLLKKERESQGLYKQQIRYFMLAAAIGFLGGASNWPLWYDIPVPPHLNVLISVYAGIIAYAIVRHRLLDIEVLIRRTLVFAGLAGSVVGVVSLMAFVSQEILARYVAIPRFWSNVLAAVLIAALYGRIQTWLVNVTDRYLFQKKYDYRELLRRFTDEVMSVLDLRKLETLTADTLMETVRLENCALLLTNRVTGRFELVASAGLDNRPVTLESNHPLVEFLQRAHEPFGKRQEAAGKAKNALVEAMSQLKAEVCFPLLLREDLVGILAFGRKKSGEDYTKEDMDVLMALASTEAIAISNALLAAEVAQKEKLAVIGTLAAAINHEVCNPLSNVKVQADGFLWDMDKGYLSQLPQEDVEKIREFMKFAVGEIDRAAAITTRLSNFAKPVGEPTSEPVDVEKAINEVLGVLGHDLELRGIAVGKVIPREILPIWADRKQLHEILFNLVRNAGQAIERTGKVTVQANMNGTAKVAIQVSDTGCGIPPEQMQRIFTPFFTTKQEGHGTGLGLFVVKQLVERNGGTIDVVSQPGSGTTFTVEFPVAKP